MDDDFRIAVEFEEEGHVLHFGRTLRERELVKGLRERLGENVVVTRDGNQVFLYAGTVEQAEAASRVVRDVLGEQVTPAEVSPVLRWHPVEERWEDASMRLPEGKAEIDVEHERWEEQQAQEAQESGYAEWEVRVDLASHQAAVDFARQLEEEGISPVVRRWKYLLIGTATDDDARALAERVRAEAPQGANVTAEPSATVGYELSEGNPFALFGGFGPGP